MLLILNTSVLNGMEIRLLIGGMLDVIISDTYKRETQNLNQTFKKNIVHCSRKIILSKVKI